MWLLTQCSDQFVAPNQRGDKQTGKSGLCRIGLNLTMFVVPTNVRVEFLHVLHTGVLHANPRYDNKGAIKNYIFVPCIAMRRSGELNQETSQVAIWQGPPAVQTLSQRLNQLVA